MATKEALTGSQKAAILCMVIGPKEAASVLQQLGPAEVEQVARHIAELPLVDSDTVNAVVQEFQDVSRAVVHVAQGGVDYAESVLSEALGSDRARQMVQKIKREVTDSHLHRLKKAAPEVMQGILRGEHPQTVALILAHLDQPQAAAVIQTMEPEAAGDILHRIAAMEKISPEMLTLVEAGLSKKTDLTLSQAMTAGGPEAVAEVLNLTPGPVMKDLLQGIRSRSEEMAGKVEALMFQFEDVIHIDGKGVQRLIRDIDQRELALALKAASPELKEHIRKNMSERAAQALEEEIELMGPVRVKDVEAAHASIIRTVRELQDANEIIVRSPGGGSDEFIG